MNKQFLKVYTKEHGLIKSNPIRDEFHMVEALAELNCYCTITKIYLTDNKHSREIKFIPKNKNTRPIYCTRSDEAKVHTLSIHPHNYPMTAHFLDGHTELISL